MDEIYDEINNIKQGIAEIKQEILELKNNRTEIIKTNTQVNSNLLNDIPFNKISTTGIMPISTTTNKQLRLGNFSMYPTTDGIQFSNGKLNLNIWGANQSQSCFQNSSEYHFVMRNSSWDDYYRITFGGWQHPLQIMKGYEKFTKEGTPLFKVDKDGNCFAKKFQTW